MNAFSLIYALVLGVIYLLALPFLLLFSLKSKYHQSIPKRFFLFKNPPLEDDCIWFHGCSLGEVSSFAPFCKHHNIAITTTTQTGYAQAQKLSKEARYLPFEIFLPFWIKKPKLLVVSEAELWYMLFYVAKNKGAKTMLINARISDKSAKSYQRFSWFYKTIFTNIDLVFAQSEKDKKRLQNLGAKNIIVNGNIKTASIAKATKSYKKPNRRVITIASSHEGEEKELLGHIRLQKNDMLIIVPRHPERFEAVKNLVKSHCEKLNLSYKSFSKDGFCQCDILVVDALGELINIYAITDITLLCGSFMDGIGGHNPLEPAQFNNVIISGKYYFNQKQLYKIVQNIHELDFDQVDGALKQELKKSQMQNIGTIEPILRKIDERRKSI